MEKVKETMKTQKIQKLLIELVVLLSILSMSICPVEGNSYRRFTTDTLSYVRAEVLEVQSEELTDSTLGTEQQLGQQRLLVKLSTGEEIELVNYLTETHNILAEEGLSIIVCVDAPEHAAPYYTVYNYDRSVPLACLVIFFVLILALIGKRKGLDACLAIVFTLVFILRIVLPALYNGRSAMAMGLLTALLSTAVTLILLQGPTKQCLLGIAATLLGELAACVLFAICSGSFHLTGIQTDEAEGLLLITQSTGLDIRTLLFAGVMISSVGAVMDVAVSILSALREVALASKRPERGALFRSGMNLGRDMIGTMSNTLIFAFTGGALTTMLVFFSYGIQFHQLLSSDYLTVELAQGICSTAAVVLTVPAASAMGAAFYGRTHK